MNLFTAGLRRFLASPSRPCPSTAGRFRPGLECLEDRALPSVMTVNTTADSANPAGNTLSLREALELADGELSVSGLSPAAQAQVVGTPGVNDTIVLSDATYEVGTAAGSWHGATGLPPITSAVTIEGNGAAIVGVPMNAPFRLFYVSGGFDPAVGLPAGSLTLHNLAITGGEAQGAAGANGVFAGGGGAGLGGAIFNQGSLTLSDVTVWGNEALGGTGGAAQTGQGKPTGGTAGFGLGGAKGGGAGGFGGGGAGAGKGGFAGGKGGVGGGGGGGGAGLGGAIFNDLGTVAIDNSTLADNKAEGGSGGAGSYSQTAGGAALVGSPGAGGSGYGGALFNFDGTVTLQSVTVAKNTVVAGAAGSILSPVPIHAPAGQADGGAVYDYFAPDPITGRHPKALVTVTNTILAESKGGNDLANSGSGATVNLSGYDLVEKQPAEADGAATRGKPVSTANPLLGPLHENGGPTPTMAPGLHSKVLGAGDPAQAGTADQRGVVRDSSVNIGAYQASASALVVSGLSATTLAATTHAITVTAVDVFGQRALDYRGTVHFTSTDPLATLPADFTFTAADGGSHTFSTNSVAKHYEPTILGKAGPQTVTVADTGRGWSVTVSTVVVANPATLMFHIVPLSTVTAGTPFSVRVSATDIDGNALSGYTGTVQFTMPDGEPAILPTNDTFTAQDEGTAVFNGLVLTTPGTETLWVMDTHDAAAILEGRTTVGLGGVRINVQP